MKTFKKTLLPVLLIFSSISIVSCEKDGTDDTNSGKATIKMNLTDAPASYEAVLIDIKEVEVQVDNSGWVKLSNINPGIYNLLDFRNGLDTLIAVGKIPSGKLSQIRLILGTDNSIVENGINTPLKTPSAQQSGLKLLVNHTLEPGLEYEFWLDFDAARSVVAKGNGGFNLKPVIKVFTKNTTGSIEGFINPWQATPTITVYNQVGDTSTTSVNNPSGYFLVQGLSAGTYTVDFDPNTPYKPKSISGVSVAVSQVTDLGIISIQQ